MKDRGIQMREFARWFDIYEFTMILWFRRMKEIMCNEDYFVMYTLFNFKPVKRFKWGSNVGMFMDASDCADKCILNLLKMFKLCERCPW